MLSPIGPVRSVSAASWINARIRELMDEPRSEERTAEYQRLLTLWAEATGQPCGGSGPEFITAA
ncbi:MAG TPA: hypothetical protein VN520_35350 [Streptomyces sp.]|uniref:hypothetical protein n=1 Tax=Streptomyces sp. TaxID=1931 RepID=UPI002BCB346D|nr:hypothetical protein [Streptomyces sp.]HWU11573.1 hypothetical protein [Streptomyces sp.]